MADLIHLSVVTSEETVFDGQVSYVNIPTSFGSVGILRRHAPMLCAVGEGRLKYRFEDGTSAALSVSSGIADVRGSEVTVLVSSAKIL